MYAAARRGSPEADPPHMYGCSCICYVKVMRLGKGSPPSTPLPPYGLSVGAIHLPFLLAFQVIPAIIIVRFMHFDVMFN